MSIVHLPVLQPVRETRSRRKREVRARTINVKRLTKRELEFGRMLADAQLEDLDVTRPVTRGDCEADERPCPFVSCKFHLYLDVADRTGAIKLNFPDVDPEQLERLPATCMLDVAERERTLEEVGEFMNMTRERIRQIEVRALTKMKRATDRGALGDYAEELPDNGRVTDADVEQLEREQAHERTKAMPNFGYSEKVWNVLSDGRRISVAQIAKDADVSYKVARQTVANFHNAGKVRIFDGEDGGIDVELVPGAERVKKRTPKAATGQKKTTPVKASTPPQRALVHVPPKLQDLSPAPVGSHARFTLRYFEAQVDCATANDVAELIGALKRAFA